MQKAKWISLTFIACLACSADKLDYKTLGKDGCPSALSECAGGGGEAGAGPVGESGKGTAGEGASGGSAGEDGRGGRTATGGRASGGQASGGKASGGKASGGKASGGDDGGGGERDAEGGNPGAGGSTTPTGCIRDADCAELSTQPAGCAVATCDQDTGTCTYAPEDTDGDRYPAKACRSQDPLVVLTPGTDCNDADPAVNPAAWDGPAGEGMQDGCNDNTDNDCSGTVDDGVLAEGATCVCTPGEELACALTPDGTVVDFPHLDTGGLPFAPCALGTQLCLSNGTLGDCEGLVAPASTETCDNVDNDCDGSVDNAATDTQTFFYDADEDLHAASWASPVTQCFAPTEGPAECSTNQTLCPADTWTSTAIQQDDCDDAEPTRYPGAPELCNRIDDDCSNADGATEEPAEDVDNDGYTSTSYSGCSSAFPRTDCFDTNADVHPGQTNFFIDGYCLNPETPYWCFTEGQCATMNTCAESIGQNWSAGSLDYDCSGFAEPNVPDLNQMIGYGSACSNAPTDTCVSEAAPTYPTSTDEATCGMLSAHQKCTLSGGSCGYASIFTKTACR